MNIMVAGGTSFIGSHLANELRHQGHIIHILARDENRAKALFGNEFVIHIADVTKLETIQGICNGIDIVYYLIAKVGNELPTTASFTSFRNVNVVGLKNLVKEAKQAKIKRFIFVSSIAAMGIVKQMPITECSQCEPYLPYQVTKREGELFLLKEVETNGFPALIARPAKVYGEGELNFSFLSIAKLCKLGIFPKILHKDAYVSHCYIDDLIKTLSLLKEKGNIGAIYNIATEQPIRFYDSIKIIEQEMKKKVLYIPIPFALMKGLAWTIERVSFFFNITPLVTYRNILAMTTDRIYDLSSNRKDLGFVGDVSMDEGIRRVIRYYMEKHYI